MRPSQHISTQQDTIHNYLGKWRNGLLSEKFILPPTGQGKYNKSILETL